LVLSPIIIGVCASAAKPARRAFSRTQPETVPRQEMVWLSSALDVIVARVTPLAKVFGK
jgi:hypothetical protein